ncbi:MAG: hypothetical protein HY000_14750 [Planctomycetes bacterium]|nr:hypothetical protein [Planctomycetota bacterium]
MPNILQSGATWLGAKLQASAGRAVSVETGGVTIPVTATLVTAEHEVMDSQQFLTRVLSCDWTFVAADLGTLELKPGTLVHDGADTYQALPLGNRPCVERLDSSGILLTLHKKKVKVDAQRCLG